MLGANLEFWVTGRFHVGFYFDQLNLPATVTRSTILPFMFALWQSRLSIVSKVISNLPCLQWKRTLIYWVTDGSNNYQQLASYSVRSLWAMTNFSQVKLKLAKYGFLGYWSSIHSSYNLKSVCMFRFATLAKGFRSRLFSWNYNLLMALFLGVKQLWDSEIEEHGLRARAKIISTF